MNVKLPLTRYLVFPLLRKTRIAARFLDTINLNDKIQNSYCQSTPFEEDLLAKIREFNNDDAKRRDWAARTRTFFHTEINNTLYAQYILEATLLKPFSHAYVWAQDINLDGTIR